jgi:uncharacterized protein YktA (UPF0223 family)
MEASMPTQKFETIKLAYELTVDVTNLSDLQRAFEKAVPGSAKRDAIFSEVKAMHEYAKARLEGECLAHMNIARKKLQELYKLGEAEDPAAKR